MPIRVREFKVREMAERESVPQRTIRLWIQKGVYRVRRTPGGGIRIREVIGDDPARDQTTPDADRRRCD